MTPMPKDLVERFYRDMWNRADENVAYEILAPDFRFRGSLGPEKTSASGFVDYMRGVHAALGDYECIIKDMIATENRVAARMFFRGIHQAEFFGVPATGKEIVWAGAAFFTAAEGRLSALWVLGDIDHVKSQLGAGESASFNA
ncbi:MAG: ester cyclase [Pseudomonadota bacterium]